MDRPDRRVGPVRGTAHGGTQTRDPREEDSDVLRPRSDLWLRHVRRDHRIPVERSGKDVVVIESDDDKASQVERDGHLVIDGDARQEPTLERAGIEDAATVVAAIDDSNVNLQISVLASQLAPEATLIVRVGEQTYASTARRAGADTVVIPEIMSGSDIAGELTD